MGSTTPLFDILSARLPAAIFSDELSALSSRSRSTIETALSFVLGGDCPTRFPEARQEWSRTQPATLKALHDLLVTKGAKRPRDNQDIGYPPVFTLPTPSHVPNRTINYLAWDDSESDDDDDDVASSEDLEHSATDSDSDGSEWDENGSQSEGAQESGDEPEEEDEEDEDEELQEAHHPLFQPGAMPRMSTKAALDMMVDMLAGDTSDEEEESE